MITVEKDCPGVEVHGQVESSLPVSETQHWFWRPARKIGVLIVGTIVLMVGLAGLLLPILPGWLLIFVGLFILGTEFAWARWVLKVAKERAGHLVDAAKKQLSPKSDEAKEQGSAS